MQNTPTKTFPPVSRKWREIQALLIPASILLAILLWEGFVRLDNTPAFILPPPSMVWTRFLQTIGDGSLLRNALVTLGEVFSGLVLGVGVASALGYLLAKSPIVERLLSPYVIASQSIPIVAIAPLLVIWFGLGWMKVLVFVLPPIILVFLYPQKPVISFSAAIIGLSVVISKEKGELGDWFNSTWSFARQILPLLLLGVLLAGALLGRPGTEGLIPSEWVTRSVGGNSFYANFFASFAGAFMYFATLTEIPILQGLIAHGMGKGPALALLLAGPALSLPSMLVLRSIMGTKKTVVYVSLVIVMATVTGKIFGFLI